MARLFERTLETNQSMLNALLSTNNYKEYLQLSKDLNWSMADLEGIEGIEFIHSTDNATGYVEVIYY